MPAVFPCSSLGVRRSLLWVRTPIDVRKGILSLELVVWACGSFFPVLGEARTVWNTGAFSSGKLFHKGVQLVSVRTRLLCGMLKEEPSRSLW